MSKKLYVGNLLYEVDDNALSDIFSQFGNVVSAQIIRYRDSGRSKGFGFVELENAEDADKAIETLNGQDHQGRRLVVSEARPMEPRQPGDRGDFRRGGDRSNGGNRGGYDRDRNHNHDHNHDHNHNQGNDFGNDMSVDMGGDESGDMG